MSNVSSIPRKFITYSPNTTSSYMLYQVMTPSSSGYKHAQHRELGFNCFNNDDITLRTLEHIISNLQLGDNGETVTHSSQY
jgi:hypothetical protein